MGFLELLGILFSKIALGFILLFFPLALPPVPPEQALTPFAASSTPPVFVAMAEKATTTPQQSPQKETAKETPTKKENVQLPPPPIASSLTPAPAPPPPLSLQSGSDINTRTRAALVNILCTGSGGPLRPASGSGIIIDPRGIIITNAHVAQYFLLKDYPAPGTIEFVIRVGSPARTLYHAELLFMPPAWVRANAHKVVLQTPTGTGEHDYALLRITGRTDPAASLPPSFPAIASVITDTTSGTSVLLAGYAAGFLDGATIQTNLFASSAHTEVGDLFTFNPGGSTDLFSVGGTILSQRGASGGAVVRESDGKLLGIIVTATAAETTAERDLRAILLSHIDESIAAENGSGLDALLLGDLAAKARIFNVTITPSLTQALIEVIEK